MCSTFLRAAVLYLSSLQLFQHERWSSGCFNCISTVSCKGSVCLEVLASVYGTFVAEEGQFINSKSLHIVPQLRRPFFFHLLTPPRFWRAESPGSQPVYRKLFPHGPNSSKNNFFEIKLSQWRETPSLTYYGSWFWYYILSNRRNVFKMVSMFDIFLN